MWLVNRKRPKKHRVDDRVGDRCHANAERQGQDCEGAEQRRRAQTPQGNPKVISKRLQHRTVLCRAGRRVNDGLAPLASLASPRLRGSFPARFVQVTIKAEILSSESLGQQDDLIGVPGEMFNDVKDRRQHSGVEALNGDRFGEPPVWQRADQSHRLIDGATQLCK